MKPAAKPKAMVSSSPGRAEKLPAPGLARLLRGKSGSRSRARSSPMFVSRSKSVSRSSSLEPALAEGGEPSSPKVTCIGQVRIRKKNKNLNSAMKNSPKSNRSDRCRCLERVLLCKFFSRRKKNASGPPCRFFLFWRKRKHKAKETAAAEAAAPPIAFVREIKIESDSEEEQKEAEDESATMHSPPKNALLLMRCRSAPHNRSSAPALCRFEAPESGGETEEVTKEEEEEQEVGEKGRGSCNGSTKVEEEGRCSSSSTSQAQPLGLMRCKSEPAKKAEKLVEVGCMNGNGSGSGSGSKEGALGTVQEEGPTTSPSPILLH